MGTVKPNTIWLHKKTKEVLLVIKSIESTKEDILEKYNKINIENNYTKEKDLSQERINSVLYAIENHAFVLGGNRKFIINIDDLIDINKSTR